METEDEDTDLSFNPDDYDDSSDDSDVTYYGDDDDDAEEQENSGFVLGEGDGNDTENSNAAGAGGDAGGGDRKKDLPVVEDRGFPHKGTGSQGMPQQQQYDDFPGLKHERNDVTAPLLAAASTAVAMVFLAVVIFLLLVLKEKSIISLFLGFLHLL